MSEGGIEVVERPRRKKSRTPAKGKKRVKVESLDTVKVWGLARADKAFSDKIIARDGKCLFPNCVSQSKLTCSHYFNRGKFGTRFDEKNCITLCQAHHYMNRVLGWEFQKQTKEKHGWDGQYTLYMKNWLGEEEFQALKQRSELGGKRNKYILAFQETLENI